MHSWLELRGGTWLPQGKRKIFVERNRERKGRKDASVLPREVGGGGAADCGHSPGGLQLPQTDALSGAYRHYHGR